MRRVGLLLAVALAGLVGTSSAAASSPAMSTYNRLWEKADRFYGADGMPAPYLRKAPRGAAPALPGMGSMGTDRRSGPPIVYARPWMLRALAGKGRHGSSVLNAGGYKRLAEKTTLNEWAKVYQRAEIFIDEAASEFNANRWAQALAKRIVARKGKRQKLPLDRSQFGSNYGANPRSIIWD